MLELDDASISAIPSQQQVTGQACVTAPTPCGSHWICCQTHPQAELWAVANLQRQGFHPYLPLIAITRRDPVTPSLTRRISVPMFRSYVFVDLDTPHWAPIQHTRGIARVLTSNGKPQHLDAAAVEAVRAAEAAAAIRTQETAKWAPGASVALRYGPLHGLPAVITAIDRDTASIAVMMLGQLRSLSIPLDCLQPRGE